VISSALGSIAFSIVSFGKIRDAIFVGSARAGRPRDGPSLELVGRTRH
jgi:hypothetical protein